jgi:hypothetical protein
VTGTEAQAEEEEEDEEEEEEEDILKEAKAVLIPLAPKRCARQMLSVCLQ